MFALRERLARIVVRAREAVIIVRVDVDRSAAAHGTYDGLEIGHLALRGRVSSL